MANESNAEGGWPGGWLVAALAGVIAAILARWLGSVGMAAAVLVGIMVFLVFGVLLGMFWTAPRSVGDGGHDDGHGEDADHGHGQAVPAMASPPKPAQAVVTAPVVYKAPVGAPVPAPVETRAPVSAPPPSVPEMTAGEVKPAGLAAPRDGKGDDLKMIEGIGPALEKQCHELGIFHFDQIAAWGPGEVAWMDANLKSFKGRVTRDKWVRQAKLIGEVGMTEFLRRAKTNDY